MSATGEFAGPRSQAIALLVLSLALIVAFPCAASSLERSTLFALTARNCELQDLRTWQHPVRHVLQKRRVQIEKVLLCNNRRYPVFFVRFRFDPQGQTSSYFSPLYEEMRPANGGHPFAFVATSDNTIVSVSYPPGRAPAVSYEMYEP